MHITRVLTLAFLTAISVSAFRYNDYADILARDAESEALEELFEDYYLAYVL